MLLNGRQIYFKDGVDSEQFPTTILLAIDDMTEMVSIAETLTNQTKQFETRITERSESLDTRMNELEEEIKKIKKEQ